MCVANAKNQSRKCFQNADKRDILWMREKKREEEKEEKKMEEELEREREKANTI